MAGVARGVVLTDAAYGSDGAFRAGVTEMGLIYAVAVQSTISVWPPGKEPLPPKAWSGRGRKPSRTRRDAVIGRSRPRRWRRRCRKKPGETCPGMRAPTKP